MAPRRLGAAEKDVVTGRVFEVGQRGQQALVVFGDEVDAVEHQPARFQMRTDVVVEIDTEAFHPLVDFLENVRLPLADNRRAPQRVHTSRRAIIQKVEPAQSRPVGRNIEVHMRRLADLRKTGAHDVASQPHVNARHIDRIEAQSLRSVRRL